VGPLKIRNEQREDRSLDKDSSSTVDWIMDAVHRRGKKNMAKDLPLHDVSLTEA
jgi:hypothetical protein